MTRTGTQPAVVFRAETGLGVEDVTVGSPGRGQVAVEIRASGVCHSDLHVVNGDWPSDRPLVLGHEASGVVVELGDDVSELAIGDHVVLSWFAPCGRCRNCAAGRAWLCTGTTALENTLPGGTTAFADEKGRPVWPYLGLGTFTDRIVVPESAVVVVPADLPFSVGALLGCSVTTGIGAVLNTAGVRAGESAAVVGCGGVGLSIIMGLALAGAGEIIAIDVSAEKLAVAERLGATTLIRADLADPVQTITDRFGGVDFAFEAIGRVPTIESLPAMLVPGGAAVLVGMTAIGARASIDPFTLADRGLRILGCNYGSSVARVDIPRYAALYTAGRLPLDQLIGQTRPVSEAGNALEDLRNGVGLRTVLVPEVGSGPDHGA
ncbi:alcohol dehydrogenase catalytic domain-containing protein [Herbiconiux sp. YIM B11900]|uniref:alcohol dehydrogenase catalytic domain-containing protein n=1 Tax=Herbiconiux sp. YIM B11900 TaxID=3404131 RepID=UPI003F85A00A